MQIKRGSFDIPRREARVGKGYTKAFREFAEGDGDEPMLKITLDSNNEALDCFRAIDAAIKRDKNKFGTFKVAKRKLDVYVIREG